MTNLNKYVRGKTNLIDISFDLGNIVIFFFKGRLKQNKDAGKFKNKSRFTENMTVS